MRYFVELSYIGTNYCGWQRQKDAPSVQQTVEEALSKLLGESVEITGVGRTDTGVHATHYVAHFDTGREIAPDSTSGSVSDSDSTSGSAELAAPGFSAVDFLYHANSILPSDIALKGIRHVPDDAHARYDATQREYTYHILPFKDPFRTEVAWQYTVPLDPDAMNRAAQSLLAASDFTSFAKLGSDNKTNICNVTMAEWRRSENGELEFKIRADRFLRNMVRAVVGTLVDVGRGKITPARFAEIIEARDLSLSSGGAPARGLFLSGIVY